ncbi:MAG: hypothetical protein ACYSU7_06165 [Planctomycetota bacterium]|jgi:hypothetical protein
MTAPADRNREPTLALPTGRMLVSIVATSVAAVLAWSVVAWVVAPRREVFAAGGAGAAVVAAVTILGVLVIRPWQIRPVGDWINWWLGAMVLRLLLTPVVAYLLYSATALSLTPLMLSVAATYVVVQVSEATVVAHYLKRVT